MSGRPLTTRPDRRDTQAPDAERRSAKNVEAKLCMCKLEQQISVLSFGGRGAHQLARGLEVAET
jgi:hypothetical protein